MFLNINRTTAQYTWRFKIDGQEHTAELFVAYLKGSRKVTLDGVVVCDTTAFISLFDYSFSIGNHIITISQQKGGFDLRIDNIPFERLDFMAKTFNEYNNDEEYNISSKSKPVESKDDVKENVFEKKQELPSIFANQKESLSKPKSTINKVNPKPKPIPNDLLGLDFGDFETNPKSETVSKPEGVVNLNEPMNLLEDRKSVV